MTVRRGFGSDAGFGGLVPDEPIVADRGCFGWYWWRYGRDDLRDERRAGDKARADQKGGPKGAARSH
ncbi:hypothetical protein [uncultured Boseongicola sp.]|uniref:hypothetical protein n=1 Tax=uncultured Boseongicola sp. TaxID=1648499 RepID=UPI00263258D6|nr:hypothetical protein [uncultured Boseongicola sp.]